MSLKKSVKRNRFKRIVFVVISVMIAIGLVIPLAGLFQAQPDYSKTSGVNSREQTPQERLAGLEARAGENPGDTAVLLELAEAYHYAGRPDQAIATYEKVLAADQGNADARLKLATIYYYSSRYDQSIIQLQELIRRDPGNEYAHYLYGIVLGTGKKDYAAGIAELEKYITLAKEGPDVEKARQIIKELQEAQVKK